MKSNCSVCGKRKLFVSGQKASGILSSLGIRSPLSRIPILNRIPTEYKC